MRNTEKVEKIKTEILSITTRLEDLTRKLRELIVSGDESDKGNHTDTLKTHKKGDKVWITKKCKGKKGTVREVIKSGKYAMYLKDVTIDK